MNKFFKVFFILFFTLILTGCTKNYSAINYSKFLGVFNSNKDYTIIDKTLTDEGIYKRSYEAGNSKYTYFYFEFENEKDASEYIKRNYKNVKKISYSEKKDYAIAKKNFGDYLVVIQTDNVIVIGMGNSFFSRFNINKTIKEIYE